MKKFLCLLAIVVFVGACKKDLSPTNTINDNPGGVRNDTSGTSGYGTSVIIKSGNFINGPYGSTRGTARILRDTVSQAHRLYLENFSVNNGPDLKVYLSTDLNASRYIRLGNLRSTNGNQIYDIPGAPDYSDYKYALIWCEAFAHLFGSAELR
ncbi:MAG TPA: DM13 domain-containing protein [Chitinophagaceae bacterium]|nr:DM13 domain-containing protein [Chitinophagaceae bacterium]